MARQFFLLHLKYSGVLLAVSSLLLGGLAETVCAGKLPICTLQSLKNKRSIDGNGSNPPVLHWNLVVLTCHHQISEAAGFPLFPEANLVCRLPVLVITYESGNWAGWFHINTPHTFCTLFSQFGIAMLNPSACQYLSHVQCWIQIEVHDFRVNTMICFDSWIYRIRGEPGQNSLAKLVLSSKQFFF